MLVIGLTGGIGMGKSTVARMFAKFGVPAFNADEAVHKLQAPNGKAIPAIAASFPGTVRHGVLNRAALRHIAFSDPASLHRLERIMHPMVGRMERNFRAQATRQRRRAILLDIPLLFESRRERRVDVSLTVSCPRDVQMRRVLRRGTLSAAQIATIIAKQMSDAERRVRADYVIPTGLSRFHTYRVICRLTKVLLQ